MSFDFSPDRDEILVENCSRIYRVRLRLYNEMLFRPDTKQSFDQERGLAAPCYFSIQV
jgi:hypothetical protein